MKEKLEENLEEVSELVKKKSGSFKKYSLIAITALTGIITLNSAIFTINGGQNAIERTPGGDLIAHMKPGIKVKMPFLSDVEFYDEVTTVTYDTDQGGKGSSKNPPYTITFADTYGGQVKGSFRVELPKDPDKLIELHKAFKTYANFVENGAKKFTNELLAYTANQFTGESFMQGGQNEYKNRLEDQARNGLYLTKRTQVVVEKQAGIVNKDSDNPSKTSDSEAVIYQNIIQVDDSGKALRQENSMAQYGVVATQVTIDGFIPQTDLESFMSNKKAQVLKRAKLVEDQENERQQAITAKLKGDRERVEAKQVMLMEKDKAEISLSKEVEVAKLQADKEKVERQKLSDLAVIDKKKELQIATANEDIQKANEIAAKYEANAILYKGKAQAEVLSEMYKARDPKLYALEKQVEITQNLKDAFSNINVEMPTNMIVNGSNGDKNIPTTSVDTVMQLLQLDKLSDIEKITGKTVTTTTK